MASPRNTNAFAMMKAQAVKNDKENQPKEPSNENEKPYLPLGIDRGILYSFFVCLDFYLKEIIF